MTEAAIDTDRRTAQIMRLKDANCRNCYKCVRACPVKAIRILGDHAEIVEDRCIYCGKCYIVCPQDARDLIGDLDSVKKMIGNGDKVYMSVSSALSVYFPEANLRRLAAVLKKMGIMRVEETAEGTGRMLQGYADLLFQHNMKNVICTACPSINFLIQKYYPDLVKWMLPVETALETHARMLRATYGSDIRVVGVGPCIAYQKLAHISEGEARIDAYLTFEELENWMNEEGLKITEEEDPDTYYCRSYRWKYPDEPQGIVKALPGQIKYNYKMLEANGETKAANILSQLDKNTDNYFMTMTACSKGCLGGPIFRLHGRDTFQSMDRWLESVKVDVSDKAMNPSEKAAINIDKEYEPMPFEEKEPGAEDLKLILSLVGRQSKKDMLDCGGCGYPSCVAKAKAVYDGMADPYLCIPNAREKAEAQSNLMFDNSPDGVLILDDKLRINEANGVAEEILGVSADELKGRNVCEYLPEDFFGHAMLKELNVVRDTVDCPEINKILAITFFKVKRHNIEIAILRDRTETARRRKEVMALRDETVSVTRDVVDKQMRVAQEIASLLGETTAESKLAFNNLRNILMTAGADDDD